MLYLLLRDLIFNTKLLTAAVIYRPHTEMSFALTLGVLLQRGRHETKGGRLREAGEVQHHQLFMGEI